MTEQQPGTPAEVQSLLSSMQQRMIDEANSRYDLAVSGKKRAELIRASLLKYTGNMFHEVYGYWASTMSPDEIAHTDFIADTLKAFDQNCKTFTTVAMTLQEKYQTLSEDAKKKILLYVHTPVGSPPHMLQPPYSHQIRTYKFSHNRNF